VNLVLVVVFIAIVLLVVLWKFGLFAEQFVVKHASTTSRVNEPK
jgi:hypothetical protein